MESGCAVAGACAGISVIPLTAAGIATGRRRFHFALQ
jgi:hypothetical protein